MFPNCTPAIVLAIVFIISVNFFRVVLNGECSSNHHKVHEEGGVTRDENKESESQG